MKYLIALAVLASSSAFAQDAEFIKCWETAQEEGGRPAYVFKVINSDIVAGVGKTIYLKYPEITQGPLQQKNRCLYGPKNPAAINSPAFEACLGQGQDIRGLIPVEIEEYDFEGTVYCERDLKKWFFYQDGGEVNKGAMGGEL